MKIKISRIWGVVLVLVMLAALLIPAAVPVSAANMQFTALSTPSFVPFNTLVTGTGSWLMDVAPDGKTIFAYDNLKDSDGGAGPLGPGTLYKSTNGGLGFSASSSSNPSPGKDLNGIQAVAIAVSNDYANDSSVVVASSSAVYISNDGGNTFQLGPSFPAPITSVDIGPDYLGGQALLVGTATGAGTGEVYKMKGFSLTPLGFNKDALAVAFSPNYRLDTEILAVTVSAGGITQLDTKLGTNAVNLNLSPSLIATTNTSTMAVLAFPADYDQFGNNRVFIGLGTKGGVATPPGTFDDVYRATLVAPPNVSQNAVDLNLNGQNTAANVNSLSFKGNLADGRLYVGLQNSPTIWNATVLSGSSVTFLSSVKSPMGTMNTVVVASPLAADTNIFVITSGAGSSFAISADLAMNFDLISLVNVTTIAGVVPAAANLSFNDLAVVDANNMFLILKDNGNGTNILYKTTNGGANWWGTFVAPSKTQQMTKIYLSPAYATDKTLYVTQNDSTIWKSSNAGASFIGLFAPNNANISAFAAVDSATYFVGTNTGVYKSGTFIAATGTTGVINSLKYVDATNLFAANQSGGVYRSTNNGVSFSSLPAGPPPFSGATMVTVDVAYATNKVVYGADAAGIKTFTIDTSVTWSTYLPLTNKITGWGQSTDGTFYASTSAVPADFDAARPANPAIWRSINPNALLAKFYGMSPALSGLATDAKTRDVDVVATGTVQVPNNTFYTIVYYDTGAARSDAIMTVQDTLVAAPAVTSPAANAQVPTNVNFIWSPVTIPGNISIKYSPQIALDAAFKSYIYGQDEPSTGEPTTAGTILTGNTLNLSPGTTYYFRVKASRVIAGGVEWFYNSKYSATVQFNVQLAQASPDLNLLSPEPGATNVQRMPVLQWAAVLGAQSYDVQVADNPVFVNPVDSQTGLNTTVWTLTKQLDYGKTYYWRIRASSASGVVSDWISGAFTVMNAPPPPTTPPSTTIAPPPVTPTVTVIIPTQPVPTITVTQQPAPTPATPAYIWVIIVIGAILVIAVIVLIARTRRV